MHNVMVIIRSDNYKFSFNENNKYYPQVCLDKCLYKLVK